MAGRLTEHPTSEGKLYLCAIKDAFSNRIVGYSIDSRMKSRLAIAGLESAVARRGDVAGCILHPHRGNSRIQLVVATPRRKGVPWFVDSSRPTVRFVRS